MSEQDTNMSDCDCTACAWERVGGESLAEAFDAQVGHPAAARVALSPVAVLARMGAVPIELVHVVLEREMACAIRLN